MVWVVGSWLMHTADAACRHEHECPVMQLENSCQRSSSPDMGLVLASSLLLSPHTHSPCAATWQSDAQLPALTV